MLLQLHVVWLWVVNVVVVHQHDAFKMRLLFFLVDFCD